MGERDAVESPRGGSLVVDRERGGKIVSLRDAYGTEWLTETRRGPVTAGGAFGDAEMAGWDECVPTITACVVNGRALPDHGDAWDVAWDGTATDLQVSGATWPYRLRRRIRAAGSGWRLDYGARTTGDEPLPLLWAAHPQFAAPPGTRLELDGSPTVVDVLDPSRPTALWTADLGRLDDLAHGGCRKLYVAPDERVDTARLVRPDGTALRLRWSSACHYLGLWFDNAAWSDEPVIAIEPALSYADSLEAAVAEGTAAFLEPGIELTWWVEISFESSPATDR